MRYDIDNFIGIYEDALAPDYCERSIAMFEQMKSMNYVTNRQKQEQSLATEKENDMLFTNKNHIHDDNSYLFLKTQTDQFCQAAWQCYALYAEKYGVLGSLAQHTFYDNIKIQKTLPSQGYHIWHCETDNRMTGSRLLLVLGYLNDVTDGGETEFLYQSRRVKPKQGTIIICPAAFTHTHRGNPPLSGVKYVINGWIEFSA
jgi:hypothetical protein